MMLLPGDDNTTAEQWLDGARYWRNRLLAESDWTQTADAPVDKAAWAAYRQALRDFPKTWKPGPEAKFPEAPTK